jgi:ABC-type Fe3+/spermidine/putrescine transport system ATPase subunit
VVVAALTKRFGAVAAVRDVFLAVEPGEFFAFLGPSGSGKSTLLGLIAGFHAPTAGRIELRGEDVTTLPAYARHVGMVFQSYSLFPHLDVWDNVAFGLRMRHCRREELARRVGHALDLVRLTGYGPRNPRELSGGQQQRVALARALVIEPRVLLLDEPLAALDKKLRDELRSELKQIQRATGVTTLFVTHDQEEALALSDRLAVMYEGQLVQCGTPEEVYRRPASRFVADFLGAGNFERAVCAGAGTDAVTLEVDGVGTLRAAGTTRALTDGQKVEFYVRPEHLRVTPREGAGGASGLRGRVVARTYLGRATELVVELANGTRWNAHVVDGTPAPLPEVGADVALDAAPPHVVLVRPG